MLLLGDGPALAGIAALASTLGIETQVCSSDGAARAALAQFGFGAVSDQAHARALIQCIDFATAAVLVFHEHDKELDILADILDTDCFYIGVLGNHAVHRERRTALARRGVAEEDLARIRAPVGTIPGAKSKATLSVGVLAEMLSEAKALNLVA
jgi:xanthine dehydrogenase accessory factor